MKTARIAAVALCLALLVLPSAAMPLLKGGDVGAEYRAPADLPPLIDSEEGLNGAFAGDFEAWLCDHFALRDAAVRADALLNYRLLRSSTNEQVVVGKGDWLYFEPTVPDYTGEGRLTNQELETIAGNLRAFSEAYAERGTDVYIAIVPNKSTLYPDAMPDRYRRRDDEGNIPLLREACEGLPLTWIDLVSPLREAAAGDLPIYYKTDTHWNDLGAAIAARTVLDAMGRTSCGYAVAGDTPFSDGDLARLMGLSDAITESVPHVATDHALPEANFSAKAFTIAGNGEGRLTMFRDSFGIGIGPWLTDAFGRSELLWQYPLETNHVADAVLVLICERNLREYLLPAPEFPEIEAEEDTVSRTDGAFSRSDFEDEADDDDFFADDEEEADDFFEDEEEDDEDDDDFAAMRRATYGI